MATPSHGFGHYFHADYEEHNDEDSLRQILQWMVPLLITVVIMASLIAYHSV